MRHIAILIIFLSCNVFASEIILTKCKVTNSAYAHLEPFDADRSFLKPNPTYYTAEKETSQEEYWLTFDKKLPQKYNIYYKSKLYPYNDWNIVDDIETKKAKYLIFNNDIHNLVLNLIYFGFQQQTYHFNLDNKYNGYMVLANIRWTSLLGVMNGSSLYFCECKGAKQ